MTITKPASTERNSMNGKFIYQCDICMKGVKDSYFLVCALCGRSLCHKHFHFDYCPECFKLVEENERALLRALFQKRSITIWGATMICLFLFLFSMYFFNTGGSTNDLTGIGVVFFIGSVVLGFGLIKLYSKYDDAILEATVPINRRINGSYNKKDELTYLAAETPETQIEAENPLDLQYKDTLHNAQTAEKNGNDAEAIIFYQQAADLAKTRGQESIAKMLLARKQVIENRRTYHPNDTN
jgi:hypothetical protein